MSLSFTYQHFASQNPQHLTKFEAAVKEMFFQTVHLCIHNMTNTLSLKGSKFKI